MRIVFMGTPETAATCLQALIDAQEQIVLVVTQPDRKKGRGQKLAPPPVKLLAQKYNLEVLQPEKIKDQTIVEKIKAYDPELIVVAAYGKILPKELIDIPPNGSINVHASLLPKYRGGAPIQWALLKGEKETGVTIMQIAETLDTGDILLQEKIPIEPDDDAQTLQEKLFNLGAQLLLKAIEQIKNKTIKRIPQKEIDATYAELIRKESGEIDWRKPAIEVSNRVRALIPWPCAHTFYKEKMLKIWKAETLSRYIGTKKAKPGEIVDEKELVVACGRGALKILELQLEGGRKLGSSDFLRGHELSVGDVLPF